LSTFEQPSIFFRRPVIINVVHCAINLQKLASFLNRKLNYSKLLFTVKVYELDTDMRVNTD